MDLFAGYLAAPDLKAQIDTDGDQEFTQRELDAWLASEWARQVGMEIDSLVNLMTQATLAVSYTGSPDDMFVSLPVSIVATASAPLDGVEHTLLIRNRYQSYRSDYQAELFASTGVEAELTSSSGEITMIGFTTDPSAAGGALTSVDVSAVGPASVDKSWGDQLKDSLLWVLVGIAIIAVVAWLGVMRLKERSEARAKLAREQPRSRTKGAPGSGQPEKRVRQSQTTRKKAVAVKTIDAPEE